MEINDDIPDIVSNSVPDSVPVIVPDSVPESVTDIVSVEDISESVPEPEPEPEPEAVEVKMFDMDPYAKGKVGFPEQLELNNMNTLGLDDKLSEDQLADIKTKAFENLTRIDAWNVDKNLDEDAKKIPGQNYAVVSFVGPNLRAKTETYGLRLMGAFETVEEAEEYIEELDEKTYDTGIVEMYKYVPSIPSLVQETQEDVDNFLNNIIIKHKVEREEARLSYEYRKTELMSNKNRFVEKKLDPVQMAAMEAANKAKEVKDITKDIINEPAVARNKTHARLIEKLRLKQQQVKEVKEEEEEKKEEKQETIVNVRRKKNKRLGPSKEKMEYQNFAAICFVGHTGNNQRVAMKIKGIFDKYEECDEFCKELRDIDSTYDILVTEMYNWIPCDPDVTDIKQVHDNEKLNKFINTAAEEGKTVNKIKNEFDTFDRINDTAPLVLPPDVVPMPSVMPADPTVMPPATVPVLDQNYSVGSLNTIENDIVRRNLDGSIRF